MKLDLNGTWEFKKTTDTGWRPGQVPGSVYRDLLANGEMEDPFYRDNEDEALRLSDYDYEYRRTFSVARLDFKHMDLICEGIDTVADIYLNGILAAKTKNMHRTYCFDVKKMLRPGENEIRIVLHSPTEYIARRHQEEPMMHMDGTMDGFTHLRKGHYMFGWDWGPQLPDLGIWRDIYIACQEEKIEDWKVRQIHRENQVVLEFEIDASNADLIEVEVVSPKGAVLRGTGADCKIVIDNPMLWWHNGYGAQPLYQVKISLGDFDSKEFQLGLRTLTVNTQKDEWGNKFCFRLNGKDIFAMGSNYIPEDNILSRTSEEKTRRLLTDCAKANHNCVRVWGGGIYLPDYFYRICDELGLIVWQDMMFACGVYNLEEIEAEVTAEITDNIKRLRHHACIGLWCGNNEIEEGWACWNWEHTRDIKYRADYTKLFEYIIPRLIQAYDPERFYWPSSPSSGGGFADPNDENRGDRHYWAVWHGMMPFEDYKNYHFRFLSEFGFESFPCMKTIESFTLPEDRNIFSYVMEKHQKNGTANGKILEYISRTYRYPGSLEGLAYLSQILQGEAMRYGIEHMRRNRGRCMGTLYWQTNDCWPVASWAGIDSFGRWKALHYKSRRFFAPILLSGDIEETKASLTLINDTGEAVEGQVVWKLSKGDGTLVREDGYRIQAEALSHTEPVVLDFSSYMKDYKSKMDFVFTYGLILDGESHSRESQLFVKPKHFTYRKPDIQAQQNSDGSLTLTADVFAQDIELTVEGKDVLFSDNYFSLLPGETKTVTVDKQIKTADLKINSVYDYSR